MSGELSSPPVGQTPTRVRYGVLGFVSALSMITYLDRVCFGSAIESIIEEFKTASLNPNLSPADFKWTFTFFTVAYAAFEIPSGWLGDVFGPRGVLIRIVLWWSLFTVMTASVGTTIFGVFIGLGALAVIRFLFGVGEAGAYPNITRALHNWFPFRERGLAQGTVWMAGRLMGGLTPLAWWLIVDHFHLTWRAAFWLFGVLGVTWCVLFARWFCNRPEQMAAVNQAERQLIYAGRTDTKAAHADVPWLKLLVNPNLWALCLMYFCGAYAWYFNITYLPSFLDNHYAGEIDTKSWVLSLLKGGPLAMGAAACLVGGWLTDVFIRRTGNRKWGRRLFGVVGQGLCGVCFLACLVAPNVYLFVLALSLAAFCNDMTMGASWATCQDIGRRYAAIVAGCMNTIGNLGGAFAGWATGTMLQSARSAYAAEHNVPLHSLTTAQNLAADLSGYRLSLLTFAVASFLGVVLWLRINATEPVTPDA
jgi:ACS family glucarate transporter-like MFS transporter